MPGFLRRTCVTIYASLSRGNVKPMRAFVLTGCAALILASCSRLTGASPLPGAAPNGVRPPEVTPSSDRSSGAHLHCRHQSFCTIYAFGRFGSRDDGAHPVAPLVALNGMLYGTTEFGGKYGRGTVFEVTTSGKETVLYTFHGSLDGQAPAAGLVAVKGNLYGTTSGGGGQRYGTVFEITTSGKERVLYRFNGKDGLGPTGALIYVNGMLYGTASILKGGHTDGIVYAMSMSGKAHIVYEFQYDVPTGGVTAAYGNLYGTAFFGPGSSSYGFVFELSFSGEERTLYSFKGPPYDGSVPVSGVIYANGNLYGTTTEGGASSDCKHPGCGTIFEVNVATGAESVLYSFEGNTSGGYPSGLIALNGSFYGTTGDGGGHGGFGTIFEVTPSAETTLYSFWFERSQASLISLNGELFGTTVGVPKGAGAHGTVFRLSL